MSFWKRVGKKFANAFTGLGIAFSTDNSFKFHFTFSILVLILGVLLQLDAYEWIFISLSIGAVFVAELFNTAIEYLVRMLIKDHHNDAKKLLDIAAGAVLFAALTAVVVGAIILGHKLWTKISYFFVF